VVGGDRPARLGPGDSRCELVDGDVDVDVDVDVHLHLLVAGTAGPVGWDVVGLVRERQP